MKHGFIPPDIRLNILLDSVVNACKLSSSIDLFGKTRTDRLIDARNIFTHLARKHTGCSFHDLAFFCGVKSHCTLMHRNNEMKAILAVGADAELIGLYNQAETAYFEAVQSGKWRDYISKRKLKNSEQPQQSVVPVVRWDLLTQSVCDVFGVPLEKLTAPIPKDGPKIPLVIAQAKFSFMVIGMQAGGYFGEAAKMAGVPLPPSYQLIVDHKSIEKRRAAAKSKYTRMMRESNHAPPAPATLNQPTVTAAGAKNLLDARMRQK